MIALSKSGLREKLCRAKDMTLQKINYKEIKEREEKRDAHTHRTEMIYKLIRFEIYHPILMYSHKTILKRI